MVVDGARQNYQRSGHNANGSFFLDPELVGGVDIVRGPTVNIYGSGAIGGVVSFRTKDINDVVRPGERWGVDMTGSYGTNRIAGWARYSQAFASIRTSIFSVAWSIASNPTTRMATAPKSATPATKSPVA